MTDSRTAPALSRALRRRVDAFLSEPLSSTTVRSYRQTLGALTGALAGESVPSAEQIEAVLRLRWGTAAPATWNRHVATVRSFLSYSERHRLLPAIDVRSERREPEDRTRALPTPSLSGSGPYASRYARRRCGGFCMRAPRGPQKHWG